MTDASAHYEQMKDFLASEILMLAVENRELQCVDDTANCIDDTTCLPAGNRWTQRYHIVMYRMGIRDCRHPYQSLLGILSEMGIFRFYIGMGWTCVLAFSTILDNLSAAAFGWLLAGGIIYTVGCVNCKRYNIKFARLTSCSV